jgi:hypothetical protein
LGIEGGGGAGIGCFAEEGGGDTGDVVEGLKLGLDELEVVVKRDVGIELDEGVFECTSRDGGGGKEAVGA